MPFIKKLLLVFVICTPIISIAQNTLFNLETASTSLKLPTGTNSERAAVIVSTPTQKIDGFTALGDWENLAEKAHKSLIKMGLDPIIYLNIIDLEGSKLSLEAYINHLNTRKVKNIIFLSYNQETYELIIAPYNGTSRLINNEEDVFKMTGTSLHSLMLATGKEIRRADREPFNFLTPEIPATLSGLSVVDKEKIERYPGQLRRSILAVERFALLDSSLNTSTQTLKKIEDYNRDITEQNKLLDSLMKKYYPFKYVMIDHMNDDQLLRNRHQFLLRSEYGTSLSVRKRLDYEINENETVFASIIPILPDQTSVKTIPQKALVYKFYIRQNITKNVHVGQWDADITWESALRNILGNIFIELESRKR